MCYLSIPELILIRNTGNENEWRHDFRSCPCFPFNPPMVLIALLSEETDGMQSFVALLLYLISNLQSLTKRELINIMQQPILALSQGGTSQTKVVTLTYHIPRESSQ